MFSSKFLLGTVTRFPVYAPLFFSTISSKSIFYTQDHWNNPENRHCTVHYIFPKSTFITAKDIIDYQQWKEKRQKKNRKTQ